MQKSEKFLKLQLMHKYLYDYSKYKSMASLLINQYASGEPLSQLHKFDIQLAEAYADSQISPLSESEAHDLALKLTTPPEGKTFTPMELKRIKKILQARTTPLDGSVEKLTTEASQNFRD